MRRLYRPSIFALAMTLILTGTISYAATTTTLYLPLIVNLTGSPLTSTNLPATTATYLGAAENDDLRVVDVAPDGSLVAGGVLPGYTAAGIVPVTLLGGTDGGIVRFSSDGTSVRSITRIGTSVKDSAGTVTSAAVSDLEVGADGGIVVCGAFGVALLSAAADAVVWQNPGAALRCAVGSDGTVAAVSGDSLYVYSATGGLIKTWAIGGKDDYDVVVDGSNQQVIAASMRQAAADLQLPIFTAWNYDGSVRWKNYDYSAAEAKAAGMAADSRGIRLALGRDGKLYFVGRSDGGNTVFGRDPRNVAAALDSAHLIKADKYHDTYGISTGEFTWYGRFNLTDGLLERGQFLIGRTATGTKGFSVATRGIAADEQGRVYIVGGSCCIESPDTKTIGGATVGPNATGAFLLILSADFKQRLLWTQFSAPGAGNDGRGYSVAVRGGRAALAADLSGGTMATYQPLLPQRPGLRDGYLVAWPMQ